MDGVKVVLLEESRVDGMPLGRHVEHDERSRAHAVEAMAAEAIKSTAWHRRGGPFNQLKLGSCTGNAAAGVVNTAPFQPNEPKLLGEADAVSIYEDATALDNIPGHYPPTDTGSSGLAVCKVLKGRGLISSYSHAFSIHAAVSALMAGPVITGIPWYEGFDTPDADGLVHIAGEVRGGHEIEVPEFVMGHTGSYLDGLVVPYNSWGLHWGLHGTFKVTVRDWATLLEQQGDVTVPHR